jgi:copper chaperone NosL
MTITDERFGAEILTKKGKTYLFDDIHCLQAYLKMNPVPEAEIAGIYLTDFLAPHNLLLLSASSLVKQESIRTPMNGNIVSFSQADSAAFYAQLWKGKTISWNNIQP